MKNLVSNGMIDAITWLLELQQKNINEQLKGWDKEVALNGVI